MSLSGRVAGKSLSARLRVGAFRLPGLSLGNALSTAEKGSLLCRFEIPTGIEACSHRQSNYSTGRVRRRYRLPSSKSRRNTFTGSCHPAGVSGQRDGFI